MKNSPFQHEIWRKRRKSGLYNEAKKYFIFCEGEKTEPNYFEAFKALIDKNPIYKNIVQINIKGTGVSPSRIPELAQDFIDENGIVGSNVWCIYDKDDFTSKDFNAAEKKIVSLNKNSKNSDKEITYRAGWSNQCIEYWFILHFDYYDVDNHRRHYIDFLNKKFKALKIKEYAKNSKNIFEVLCNHGNPELALRYAKKRIKECRGKTPSNSAPATKVHELVEELVKYLPENVRKRFENSF